MITNSPLIEIDGSFGEAGGQLLRTACALSAITRKPCHIFNIRKGRSKPGLQTQHLLGIQTLAQFCNGRLEGDFLGSEEIKFYPGEISTSPSSLNVKIPTAGSLTLVLQTLIPPILFSSGPVKITFDGGATDTFFSPTIDHFRLVFLKILEKMDPKVEVNIIKRGYYPEGGAKVEVKVPHQNKIGGGLKPLNLIERGRIKRILVISGASEFLKNKKVSERQLMGAREVLRKLKLPIEEKSEYYDTQCPGSSICIISEFENTILGSDNLGKLGIPAEEIGRKCALQLLEEEKSKACLDKFIADQILVYLALAQEKSQVTVSEITNHCKTNIWVVGKFLDGDFKIKNNLISWIPKNS